MASPRPTTSGTRAPRCTCRPRCAWSSRSSSPAAGTGRRPPRARRAQAATEVRLVVPRVEPGGVSEPPPPSGEESPGGDSSSGGESTTGGGDSSGGATSDATTGDLTTGLTSTTGETTTGETTTGDPPET